MPEADSFAAPEAASRTIPSFKRNYLLNAATSLLNIVYPLFTMTYVSRVVGPAGMGRYYFALSLATTFTFIAALGIPIYGAREISKRRHDPQGLSRVFSELFTLNLAASLITGILFLAMVVAVPAFHRDTRVILVMGSLVFLNMLSIDYLFQGLEAFGNLAWRSLITKLASLALLFPLVRGPDDLTAFAWWTVFGVALGNLLALAFSLKRARLTFSGLDLRRHFRPIFLLAAASNIATIYTSLDSVLLGFLSTPESVGLYNTALRVNRILTAFIVSTGMVFIPRISHYISQDMHDEFASLAAKSLDLICLFTFPTAAFVFVAAPEMTLLLFGAKFQAAALVMRITSPLVVIIGFTNVIGLQILFPKGEEAVLAASVTAAAAVSLGLNFWLAPRFGQVGSAVAILGAETTVLLVQVSVFRAKYHLSGFMGWQTWKYFLASPLAAAPALALKAAHLPPAVYLGLGVAAGGAVYFASMIASGDSMSREMLSLGQARLRRWAHG